MESLAQELFLSAGAVRQNLSGLTAQGIVKYGIERGGPGRPRHIYQLTADGQRLFPDFYDELAVALVTAVEAEASEVAERVLNRVAEVMFSGLAARVESRRPDQRVPEVVKVLNEYGYLPEVAVWIRSRTKSLLATVPSSRSPGATRGSASPNSVACNLRPAVPRSRAPGMTPPAMVAAFSYSVRTDGNWPVHNTASYSPANPANTGRPRLPSGLVRLPAGAARGRPPPGLRGLLHGSRPGAPGQCQRRWRARAPSPGSAS